MNISTKKKQATLCILEILKKYSSADNVLSKTDLLEYLNTDYGIVIDRRTLYSNIDMLLAFGYNISTYKENGIGYFLDESKNQLSRKEILTIITAVNNQEDVDNQTKVNIMNKLLKDTLIY